MESLAPTAGSAQIGGFEVGKGPRKVKELIGVCPQEAAVFKFLTGMENRELFGTLHGMNGQAPSNGPRTWSVRRTLPRLLAGGPSATVVG
jgi:ABC-type multidrug transport system ATPase subunit